MNQEKSGECVKWIADKGFGFIKPDDGGEDVFCHNSGILGRKRELNEGERVTFILSKDRDGRERAAEVEGDGSGEPAKRRDDGDRRDRGRRGGDRGRDRGRRGGDRSGGYGGGRRRDSHDDGPRGGGYGRPSYGRDAPPRRERDYRQEPAYRPQRQFSRSPPREVQW